MRVRFALLFYRGFGICFPAKRVERKFQIKFLWTDWRGGVSRHYLKQHIVKFNPMKDFLRGF